MTSITFHDSFHILAPHVQCVMQDFVAKAHQAHPHLSSLLDNAEVQGEKCAEALSFLCDHDKRPLVCATYFYAMGQRCADSGLKCTDLDVIEQLLMQTVRDFYGDAWSMYASVWEKQMSFVFQHIRRGIGFHNVVTPALSPRLDEKYAMKLPVNTAAKMRQYARGTAHHLLINEMRRAVQAIEKQP